MAPLRRQSSARLLPIALALVAACGDDSTGVPSLGGSGVTVTASPTAVTAIQGDESELFTVTVTRQGNYTGNTLVRIRETSAPPVGVTVVGGASTVGAVTTWTMQFDTTPDTPLGTHDIVLEAVPDDGSTGVSTTTATVRLTVLPATP